MYSWSLETCHNDIVVGGPRSCTGSINTLLAVSMLRALACRCRCGRGARIASSSDLEASIWLFPQVGGSCLGRPYMNSSTILAPY